MSKWKKTQIVIVINALQLYEIVVMIQHKNKIQILLFLVLLIGIFAPTGCLNYKDRWTGGIGVKLIKQDQLTVIDGVIPKIANENYTLQPGDILLAVDGKEISNLSMADVFNALSGPVGSHVSIVIQRENQLLAFSIERIMHQDLEEQVLRIYPESHIQAGVPTHQDTTQPQSDSPEMATAAPESSDATSLSEKSEDTEDTPDSTAEPAPLPSQTPPNALLRSTGVDTDGVGTNQIINDEPSEDTETPLNQGNTPKTKKDSSN